MSAGGLEPILVVSGRVEIGIKVVRRSGSVMVGVRLRAYTFGSKFDAGSPRLLPGLG